MTLPTTHRHPLFYLLTDWPARLAVGHLPRCR